ncbi:hypothetical protein AAFF_G00318340 [Aldrovandia affinis]|uniref:Cytokine receptor-like factor 2-like domain-containing protein n=1 Tax=Aldrovandia affinis TaxID=143900 RepID=A0AAD7SMK0_9TELE|nr:hypothetical protein AAFF_G00318340 [Aldrovandia affinis]
MDLRLCGFFLATYCGVAFPSVSDETGALPPPSHVSLILSSHFCVNLSWSPPENLNSSTCDVRYLIIETTTQGSKQYRRMQAHFNSCLSMNSGVNYTMRTQPNMCPHRTDSEDVVRSIPPRNGVIEKLVEGFQCVYTPGSMNCTWQPPNQTRDLQLYYWYENMAQPLEHCGLYLYTGDLKTGCHLHGDFLNFTNLTHEVFFLINGTHGSSTLWNTFQMVPRDHMKPSPPKLRITELESMLELYCDPPSGFDPKLQCWDYTYRYKSSKSAWEEKNICRGESALIPYDQRFQYRVQVKAICREICGKGASDWSQEVSYGQDQAPDWSYHMALISIPVVVTICVILFLFFLKKLRVLILPQIPDPMKLFKDLINSTEDPTAVDSHLRENTAILWGKSFEKQNVYVPEMPELCVDVMVLEFEPILEP